LQQITDGVSQRRILCSLELLQSSAHNACAGGFASNGGAAVMAAVAIVTFDGEWAVAAGEGTNALRLPTSSRRVMVLVR